ncbi:MAG: ATP synthase subunit I [Defluviitaleaceae bacterium]|nr:ATP synthase subunit I [Defluviitaleaceae bacterium]
MDYSVNAVANKMVFIIALLSLVIALGGLVFYHFTGDILGAIPFAVGAATGGGVNIIKVLWLKRTVSRAVNLDATSASLHLKGQYFLRLMLTLAVLLISGFLHGTFINLIGVAIALLATMPIASYSMQFFVPKDKLAESVINAPGGSSKNPAQNAVDEINAIVAEAEKSTEASE